MNEIKTVVDGVEITTRRYVGWKEIMGFVELGRKTILRLEKSASFPLRRMPGPRGKVFVYSDEVEKWMRARTLKTTKDRS